MANTTELERARPVILVTDYGYEDKVKAENEVEAIRLQALTKELYRMLSAPEQH